ncbi:MAG: hypothetical protein HOV94_15315 [Saccharothrix sp.]|nr:hypothetical protein [Saccharothrix sp.]
MNARLDELDTQEDRLLDLLGDPDWPRAKIKSELAAIERERTEIQGQLTDTSSKLDQGREFFTAALALLADLQGFYRRGSDAVKRAMTKVIFNKLHIDAENVAGHDLTDGIKGLVEAGATTGQATLTSENDESGSTLDEDGAAFDLATDTDLLGVILADHGSSRAAMVEECGFEPRRADTGIVRGNCPFHGLARQHADLVCGLAVTDLTAVPDPAPDRLDPAG